MRSLLFPLCCICHMPDYLPISFVCQGDRPHTHTNTHLISFPCVYGFLLFDTPILASSFFLSFKSPLSFHHSFFHRLSLPHHFYSLVFSPHFYLSLPFPLPLCLLLSFRVCFIILPSSLKIILLSSGMYSIHVIRQFKSLKEDCTIVCTKLIFHSVNV